MSRVADILNHKGREVYSIDQEATAFEALEKMVRHDVGALVVTSAGRTVGVFSERDFLRRIALRGHDPEGVRVADVMTQRLICADPRETVEDCMAIMTQEHIRHLPIIEGEKLVGLVSIGDLVKHLSAERHVQIRYLTDYITGKYPG